MTSIISCDCSVCQGRKAEVRGNPQLNAVKRHNLVALAHSPLAASASGRKFGPWPIDKG
jgi:hypothetical protein